MRIKNEDLALSSNSLAANITSEALWLSHIVNYSLQMNVTGGANGTFKLQGSNDFGSKDAKDPDISNWADLGIEIAISSDGSYILQDRDCGYKWVRLVWTGTGAGTVSVRFMVKGV